METRTAFCPRCEGPIHVTLTDGPGGHANVPDGEVVCLDFHDKCTEGSCPLHGLPGVVMGVRLARSGLKPLEEWDTVTGVCDGCGNTVEMEVLDKTYAVCSICNTTNEWQLIKLDDESHVAVMQKKWKEQGGPPY